MRKLAHILIAVSILLLLIGVLSPSLDEWDEWFTRPSDPEVIIDSIVVDGRITRVGLLYRNDFPIEVLIDHVVDDRPMRRSMYATHGPNRAWMLCSRVLESRLGLGPDPDIREKWVLPVPDFISDRAAVSKWWQASSKDELLIRHEMATWQLAEMEKSTEQFERQLPFKRRQVAETKRLLDGR